MLTTGPQSQLHFKKKNDNDNRLRNIQGDDPSLRFNRTATSTQSIDDPCILTIQGNQYNMTAWAKAHPGGSAILQRFHNQDATEAFYATGHSQGAIDMLQDFLIIDDDDDEEEEEVKHKNTEKEKEISSTTDKTILSTKTITTKPKSRLARIRTKLFTKEDPIGIHKYAGLFCLFHFAFRYLQTWFGDPSAGFGTRQGLGSSPLPLLCLIPHTLLSLSSLLFHTVPRERIVGRPMIWQEFRAHNIIFGIRSILATLAAWTAIRFPQTRTLVTCFSCGVVLLSMYLANMATEQLRDNSLESTTATMPYWEGCSVKTQRHIKIFYALCQFMATMACCITWNPAWPLVCLFPIQIASLLMTLVRKGLLSTKGYHLAYGLSLCLPFLTILRTTIAQPKEVGLKSVLARRGFQEDLIYTVPVQRGDWIKVAGGLLDIPDFYVGNAKATGRGYGWYIQRLKATVDLAHEQSGGEKVLLLGHSAGGWLARAAMADGIWCEENGIQTCDRVRCLVTMGAIHKEPIDAASCVTRGALKNTNAMYPGAFLKDSGIGYVSIGGAAIVGDNTKDQESKTDADELYSNRGEGSASRVAFNSYEAVCGKGNVIGDGVVPFDWSQLDGSRKIKLDGVLHSINEAGTTIPTDRWYGSEAIIDSWLPSVLDEAGLSQAKAKGFDPFAGLQEWASNLMVESSSRRAAIRNVGALVVLCTGSAFFSTSKATAMYENAPVADSSVIRFPSGVSIQDFRPGDGEAAAEGKRVNIQWSLKRSNGYSVDSSTNNNSVPFIFVIGAKDGTRAIAGYATGLDEGIRGLRVGGIRRIVIPPSLAYVEGLRDNSPGPIPPDFGPRQRIQRVMNMIKDDIPGESFLLDVKLTRVQ
ncbi:unnamed protein product [Cylindrotheca closterium]|uniref:peptidylprolyl isomerase n=1 Tax=Cylindrotheca closterium TaxID=2856 RepID=A0AAD2FIM2_9STRA|nr:unnamed protein product [Cylindrotheca closterium]